MGNTARSELVVLQAWRTRLCARGLRESQERMRRAIAGGGLDVHEAMAIAESMESAIAMLRRTAARLEEGTELRDVADAALAAFDRWRAAAPRTERSRTAALRFGAIVRDLEQLAEREASPGARVEEEEAPRADAGEPDPELSGVAQPARELDADADEPRA